MSTHARLSSSGSSRWLHCPGSLKLEEDAGVEEDSKYAREGTVAHSVCESLLLSVLSPSMSARREVEGENSEMYEAAYKYVCDIEKVRPSGRVETYVERRVDMSKTLGLPETYGTVDCLVVGEKVLQVHDFKYGKGIRVDAEDNSQMQMYALGALEEFDASVIEIYIHQPRLKSLSYWRTTKVALLEFARFASERGKLALKMADEGFPLELLASASSCRWCNAKRTCPQLKDRCAPQFRTKKPVPVSASHEEFALMAGQIELAKIYIKTVEEELRSRLLRGVPVRGFKLVDGRAGRRKWCDEELVSSKLSSLDKDFFTHKVLSPAQILKKDKKIYELLEKYIVRKPSEPVVVGAEDKRLGVGVDVKKLLEKKE